MEQSQIIVNYITDKYGGDEPEKKRLRYEKNNYQFLYSETYKITIRSLNGSPETNVSGYRTAWNNNQEISPASMDMRSKSVYISKKLVVNIACEMNKKVLTFIFYVLKV